MTFTKLHDLVLTDFYEENQIGRYLASSATKGMWPWVPETVDLYVDYNIDDDEDRLTVEARNPKWGNWLFYAQVILPREVRFTDPAGSTWVKPTYDLLVHSFRNRPIDHIIGDNIILGEY